MEPGSPNPPSLERRRSSRIQNPISIVVRGVDILGQPFEERTSTLSFNLHGCRYPSKHHVLRNTWITLEVNLPDAKSGGCYRARVASVQRPRTVRELFQIGIELEGPSNAWGIPTPPQDWTLPEPLPAAEPESSSSTIPGTAEVPGAPATLDNFLGPVFNEWKTFSPARPEAETSGTLGIRELAGQIERSAHVAAESAAAQAEERMRRAIETQERERRAVLESSLRELRSSLEQRLREAGEQLFRQIGETREQTHTALAAELEAELAGGRAMLSELHAQMTNLHDELVTAAETLRHELADARRESAALPASSSERLHGQIAEAIEHAARDWGERLESEMAVARQQWHELVQSSLDSAVSRLVARLSESAEDASARAEKGMGARMDAICKPFAANIEDANRAVAQMKSALEVELVRARSSLAEIEQAAARLSDYSAQVEAASHDTVNELHQRLERALADATHEISRRTESALSGAATRLEPLVEAAAQQAVANASAHAESATAPLIARVEDALRRLATRESQAEEGLRVHRERLRQSSEQYRREAEEHVRATSEGLRAEFEEARRAALAKWNEELEVGGVRAANVATENLSAAIEWQSRQAQASLEQQTEKILVRAGQTLGEKSEESLRALADQMDGLRSIQAGKARATFEATVEEIAARLRSRFDEVSGTAAAEFSKSLGTVSAEALTRFSNSLGGEIEQGSAAMKERSIGVQTEMGAAAAHSLDAFRTKLGQQAESAVKNLNQTLRGELAAAEKSFDEIRVSQETAWQNSAERLVDESASQFEKRLAMSADSWMLASVRKLNEHGQPVVDQLSRDAEQELRRTCTEVFDRLAESMRQQLLGSKFTSPAGKSSEGESAGQEEKSA